MNKNKKNPTLIYALGGLGEVGKNMYCFEYEDEIVIIDAGVKFPEESMFGVNYMIPEYTYLIENQHKIKALIITHGHEDHIGGIPFLLKVVKVPKIYVGKFGYELIKNKLAEKKDIFEADLQLIDDSSQVVTKHFTCGFFNTIHSIPDSYGILLNTPNGRIVSTGDFKFDLTPVASNSDYQKMAYMGQVGIDLLLSDSTNSSVEGFSISERDVAVQMYDTIAKTQGRLIVATFASNFHRIQQILESAVSLDRKIAVFGRSMENVIKIGLKLKEIKIPESAIIEHDQIDKVKDKEICIICTGSQGEPLAALSRIANGTHRQIRIKPGDTVVFSSSPIPGNAVSINHVINSLTRAGAKVYTNSILNSLHTTGHASAAEQKLMLQLIKPKFFMPMHGEFKMLKQHGQHAIETGIPAENIFYCANGDVLELLDGQVSAANYRFPADDIFVDGNDSTGLSMNVLRDRMILGDDGLVAAIITIDSRESKLLCKVTIITRGFIFIKENQTLIKEAERVVFNALKQKEESKLTFAEIKNTVRSTLEPFLYNNTHRNPIVIPVILNHVEAQKS
ncbi:MAG: ribonuclease J [Erysipelotrichaceae bacterium]